MQITRKNIRNVAVGNLIIFGLAACSSTPAPWTQQNDSPWGAKYESQAQDVPSDDVISDTTLNDPVLLADPEPVYMQEPEMAPAPEVIVPVVVEELTPEESILAMPASNYAVQVYASNTADSAEKYKSNHDLTDAMVVKTDRSGSIVYVLVDIYPDRTTANAASADLEARTGSKPWVRSLAGLQKIVAQ